MLPSHDGFYDVARFATRELRGQGGDDIHNGGAGVDQFFDGSGNDTIITGPGGNLGTDQVSSLGRECVHRAQALARNCDPLRQARGFVHGGGADLMPRLMVRQRCETSSPVISGGVLSSSTPLR